MFFNDDHDFVRFTLLESFHSGYSLLQGILLFVGFFHFYINYNPYLSHHLQISSKLLHHINTIFRKGSILLNKSLSMNCIGCIEDQSKSEWKLLNLPKLIKHCI